MGVVILAGVCLVVQILLAMGWLSAAAALRTWAATMQDGWRKESVDTLKSTCTDVQCCTAKRGFLERRTSPQRSRCCLADSV